MKHNMKLNEEPYTSILYGKKDIELRLNDEKRQKIQVGDIITFTNINTKESFDSEVLDLYKSKDFSEIYNKFDKERLGYKSNEEADPKDMEKYYSEEMINKYGVVGIKVKKLK